MSKKILLLSEGDNAVTGFEKFVVTLDDDQIRNATDNQLAEIIIALFHQNSASNGVRLDASQINLSVFDKEFEEWVHLSTEQVLGAPSLKVRISRRATAPAVASAAPAAPAPKTYAVTIKGHDTPPFNIPVPPQPDLAAFKTFVIQALAAASGLPLNTDTFEILYCEPDFDEFVSTQTLADVEGTSKLQLSQKAANAAPVPTANQTAVAQTRSSIPIPAANASASPMGRGPGAMAANLPTFNNNIAPPPLSPGAITQTAGMPDHRGQKADPAAGQKRRASNSPDRRHRAPEEDNPYDVVYMLMIVSEELKQRDRVTNLNGYPHVRKSRIMSVWSEFGATNVGKREDVWNKADRDGFIEIEFKLSTGNQARLRSSGKDLLDDMKRRM